MTIATNNVPRPLFAWYELTRAERADFAYLAPADREYPRLFRYRGEVYDSCEVTRLINRREIGPSFAHRYDEDSPLAAWHGIAADSAFTAVVVRFTEDCESVVVGRYSV